MTIKAIGFDYGGVISGIIGKGVNEKIESIIEVTPEIRKETYFQFNHLHNNGLVSYEEMWKMILTKLDRLDKYDELLKYITDPLHHEIHEDVVELIDILKNNGYKIGLLSNNSQKAADTIRTTGLAKHFDAVVVSAEVGCSKPDPKIFQIFCDRLQITPDELIFIDDSQRSLSTAAEIGYRPILYTDYDSLIEELKKLEIKV